MNLCISKPRCVTIRSLIWGAAFLLAGCSDVNRPIVYSTPLRPTVTTSGEWTNEPPGAVAITDQPFDSRTSGGWGYDSVALGVPTIVSDPSAPSSAPNVVDFEYPSGFPGGGFAPGAEWTMLPNSDRVYVGLWWKASNPWEGNGSVIEYVQTANANLSLGTDGPSGGPYQVYVAGGTTYWPNQPTAITVTPGTWYKIELLVDKADPAHAHIEWWVNGNLVGNYTNLQFPTEPIVNVRLGPTWSNPSSKTENDYLRYDQVHISGSWPNAGSSPLLFDEEFAGTTQAYYESRGWYDGTAGIPAAPNVDGYKFLTDATLGRNVLYHQWVNAGTMGGGTVWRLFLNPATTGQGVTMYALWKPHNFFGGTSFNAHVYKFFRGISQFGPTNQDGQMNLNMTPLNTDSRISNTADRGATTFGNPWSYTNDYAPSSILHWGHTTNVYTDASIGGTDQWWETAWYVLPSSGNGTNDGTVIVMSRPYGTSTWTEVMNGTLINTANLGAADPTDINIEYFMLSPYLNNATSLADVRIYWASIRLYAGNAICNGTIDPLLTC